MKIKAAIVGATGIAGQQVLAALDGHPYFEIAALAASERSAGKTFAEAITDAQSGMRRWYVGGCEPPAEALGLEVQDAKSLGLDGIGVVFAAVESEAARELEPIYAALVPTISTARPHRMEPDVPLVIPGVNLDHLALVNEQRRRRGWKGYIATLPNCTATGLAITLKALDAALRRRGRDGDDDAGNLGRGPRPARARYRREHHPVHPARRRARDDRDAQDPRPPRRRAVSPNCRSRERDLHARRRCSWAYRGGRGVAQEGGRSVEA